MLPLQLQLEPWPQPGLQLVTQPVHPLAPTQRARQVGQQVCVLQLPDSVLVLPPEQAAPPQLGLGLLHDRLHERVFVPPPQVSEQPLQPPQLHPPQPPLTAGDVVNWLHAPLLGALHWPLAWQRPLVRS